MTLDFYSLKEQPFGAIPDTRFLFVSSSHRQALGSLLLALQKGSRAVMLVGQAGLGKTTLLFHMFKTLQESVTAIYLFQAPQNPVDLLRSMLVDFGVLEFEESPQKMLRLLKELLVGQAERQRPVVVIIDQAQNLTPSVLEVLWGLSDPGSGDGMLLQFVLSGPAEIAEDVALPDSLELSYRAPTVARLEPFDQQDTALYVDYRLRMAGYDRDFPLFTPEASALIARYSDGIPRKINNLCFTSLSLGFKGKRPKIEADIVRGVIADLGLDGTQFLTEAAQVFVQDPQGSPVERVLNTAVETAEADLVLPIDTESVTEPDTVANSLPAEVEAEVRQAPVSILRSAGSRRVPVVFSDLIPTIGLAAAVLLVAAATVVNVRRHALPVGETPSVTAVPHPGSSAPSPTSRGKTPSTSAASVGPGSGPRAAEPNLQGMSLKAAVAALSGRSVMDICKANFGRCDSKELREIRGVNPRLVVVSQHKGNRRIFSHRSEDAATRRAEKAPAASSE